MSSYPLFNNLPEHKHLPDFLKKFQIDYDKPAHLLSGGQRQINANMVMDFVSELVTRTKLTTLIISHDNELVETYSQEGFYEITSDHITEVRSIAYKIMCI